MRLPILYKIEAAVRIGMTHQTPTDLPCQWNQMFTQDLDPSPICDIIVYTEEAKTKIKTKAVAKKYYFLHKKIWMTLSIPFLLHKTLFSTPATLRGKEHESSALLCYREISGNREAPQKSLLLNKFGPNEDF